jgi:hypothetical protein
MKKPKKALGDCFEVAANTLVLQRGLGWKAMKKVLTPEQLEQAQIVHALVTHPGTGQRHCHAWVEAGGLVFEFANGFRVVMPKERYYRLGEVNPDPLAGEYAYYDRELARECLLEHGTYGPWTDDLIAA